MHRWTKLQDELAHDAKLHAELAAVMWREAVRWPSGELTSHLARNTLAVAGIAEILDLHGVRITVDALALRKRSSPSSLASG